MSLLEHELSSARSEESLRRARIARSAAAARQVHAHGGSREHLATTAAKLARWLDAEAARRAVSAG